MTHQTLEANQKSIELSRKLKLYVAGLTPNELGAYRVILTFDQLYALQKFETKLRGTFEWWTHRDYSKLQIGEQADTCQIYTWFVDQTSYDGNILYVSPRLDVPDKGHLIQPPTLNKQRNALRIEFIPPEPRCNLQPKTEHAVWVLNNRPFHIEQFWSQFGYCVRKSCEFCPVAHYHVYKIE